MILPKIQGVWRPWTFILSVTSTSKQIRGHVHRQQNYVKKVAFLSLGFRSAGLGAGKGSVWKCAFRLEIYSKGVALSLRHYSKPFVCLFVLPVELGKCQIGMDFSSVDLRPFPCNDIFLGRVKQGQGKCNRILFLFLFVFVFWLWQKGSEIFNNCF